MANPAPTINQINAFNVTQGTTIDFNIIGGTELVRSNRIYIYDLSDNSLICTHLYISTESIHELPANTDSSMVYESGKSSADFVNGAQYYAQIQTFTDIAGTEGGSGLSVAKMFWCLVDPTLTITTIPSTISTTSYNISATYNANTSVVSNIIQQYQFSLYSATGSLLQSSGVIVGNGTQQGTSTAYDISYNFSGLSVGSSYYVVVEVTTTQGMSVTTQSNTFTVSIDTPTLGEATVVNNACDGYISVTSNLSGEYGGSGSGEIVSFETDSENVFTKLQVDLDPIQDLHGYDSPWVGGAGKNKFSGNYFSGDVSTHYLDFFGGHSATGAFKDNGISVKASTTYAVSISFPTTPDGNWGVYGAYTESTTTITFSANASGSTRTFTFTPTTDTKVVFWGYVGDTWAQHNVSTIDGIKVQVEQGSTATAWTPYENICPISGHDEVGVSVVGKNLVKVSADSLDNSQKSTSVITDSGITVTATGTYGRRMDVFTVEIGKTYTLSFKGESDGDFHCVYVQRAADWSGGTNVIARLYPETTEGSFSYTFTATTNVLALGWYVTASASSGYMTIKDLQLELGSTATTYEPYDGQSYTTSLGQTVYGGTLDLVSGELTVDRVSVDLGTLVWVQNGAIPNGMQYSCTTLSDKAVGETNFICSDYETHTPVQTIGMICGRSATPTISINSSNTDYTSFVASLSGVQLCYELATPQTYQLTPQQIQTFVGKNNVWSEQGDVEVTYNIPITNLLVKRQDVDDVSGDWLTLYSQLVSQASDMDFTFIDFTNQYGKTYKYALVPLLNQIQSGVEVEVEGGYTVSDEVQSTFDGVFIADQTGLQKCKANVGYGNVDMNQTVGTITPIGAKYPVVITNSKNQYHNGSISGTIVPDDYYVNGNLSRIDMVNKRNELEQFLTNKRAKIIKDWNSNIWLVMITDNIGCNFNNNYGMGMVSFNANWIEVGDPTNQQDLQATGLINVGGV